MAYVLSFRRARPAGKGNTVRPDEGKSVRLRVLRPVVLHQALARAVRYASAKGDCVVAELERLEDCSSMCEPTDEPAMRTALRRPLRRRHSPADAHLVGEGRGGSDVAVEVRLAGAKTCRGGPCPIMSYQLQPAPRMVIER